MGLKLVRRTLHLGLGSALLISLPLVPLAVTVSPVVQAAEQADLLDINTATADQLKAPLVLVMRTQSRSSRGVRTNGRMSWCRRRFFLAPRMRGSNTKLW
jgi:hypothetical protein